MLKFHLKSCRPTPPFHDRDMLALYDLFLLPGMNFVDRIDLTLASRGGSQARDVIRGYPVRGIRSYGAVALANMMTENEFREVNISGNYLGGYGAEAIAEAVKTIGLRETASLSVLKLRGCKIGARGAQAFAVKVAPFFSGDLNLDLSNNNMGNSGVSMLANALQERDKRFARSQRKKSSGLSSVRGKLVVDVSANLVLLEVLNAATHGVGILLCVMGFLMMLEKLALHEHSQTARISCSIYSCSLLTLYISSTLYHSFFKLIVAQEVFSILDHAAIYLLIAGTYTPIVSIVFRDKWWSTYMLAFQWGCTAVGIVLEAFYKSKSWKSRVSLTMYLSMGWTALICLPQMIERFSTIAIYLLVAGGIGYTGGVPFFVRNQGLDHCIWHLFVIAGSLCHWILIYAFVLPMDLKVNRI